MARPRLCSSGPLLGQVCQPLPEFVEKLTAKGKERAWLGKRLQSNFEGQSLIKVLNATEPPLQPNLQLLIPAGDWNPLEFLNEQCWGPT